LPLAGGPLWFAHVQRLERGCAPLRVAARDLPDAVVARLTGPRAPIAGLTLEAPRIMGIVNVTPDSFSDGGAYGGAAQAIAHGQMMALEGADLIDVGGESTRPGAVTVPDAQEIARISPVVAGLADSRVSIDTRKAVVAREALAQGAVLVNDVAGFTYDAALAPLCIAQGVPVCIMHAQGDPETMQKAPRYDDVLLDVYEWLEARIAALEAQGMARSRMIVDPGIGFGKNVAHNLALLRGVAAFHGLGCAVLIGASRKGFIGTVGAEPDAQKRIPGSVAVALACVAQGVQILRVHDVAATRQALALWQALRQEQ